MNLELDTKAPLTGHERTFGHDELIVSKTDEKGRITYANEVFLRVSGYTEDEILGRAHNIIRHPGMPRCVFKFLWDNIMGGRELFAYVVNRCKFGDHYWVFAHVTPTFDAQGQITGFHSSRRSPKRSAINQIEPIYQELRSIERQHKLPKDQIAASTPVLHAKLDEIGLSYEEYMFTTVA